MLIAQISETERWGKNEGADETIRSIVFGVYDGTDNTAITRNDQSRRNKRKLHRALS